MLCKYLNLVDRGMLVQLQCRRTERKVGKASSLLVEDHAQLGQLTGESEYDCFRGIECGDPFPPFFDACHIVILGTRGEGKQCLFFHGFLCHLPPLYSYIPLFHNFRTVFFLLMQVI